MDFNTDCRACPRLADFLAAGRAKHPDYYCKPVPPFGDLKLGDAQPGLLIVGLAPGFHGANQSGRPFTGDHAGILLYETLHAFGYASRPVSLAADDGLQLIGCRITNAVKCVPPENKPETGEIKRCNEYLQQELAALPPGTAILALGLIAHKAVLMALGLKASDHVFAHDATHSLPGGCVQPPRSLSLAAPQGGATPTLGLPGGGLRLYDSYHCSRYNTQTRRLTPEMFRAVFARIATDRKE